MFGKILVCSDNSIHALNAAQAASAIAHSYVSNVLILHVFEAYYPEMGYLWEWISAVHPEEIDNAAKAQCEAVEQQIRPLFENVGVPCAITQERGHAVESIVRVAAREQVDLIVLGSRGLGGFEILLLGSVSDGVLHHAHCPVLIVRGENAPRGTEGLRRILLCSDASEGAHNAAQTAVALAQKFGSSLDVLNVFDVFTPLPGLPVEDNEPIVEVRPATLAERVLEEVMHDVQDVALKAKVHCTFHQEQGHHAEAIVRFASKHQTDLIVMGSRGYP